MPYVVIRRGWEDDIRESEWPTKETAEAHAREIADGWDESCNLPSLENRVLVVEYE